MKWLGRILAALEALFGGKANEHVAYDEGTTYGQAQQTTLDQQKALQDAVQANAIRDNVGRMPSRSAASELRTWNRKDT